MSAEPDTRGKLRRLAAAHFLAGLGLAAFVNPNVSVDSVPASINVLFTALIGSELGLLGLCLAAAVAQPANRSRSTFAIGAATLWVWLLAFFALGAVKPSPPSPPALILWLAPVVSLASWAFGFALWAWGVRLIRVGNSSDALIEAFQFTIRHLFWLTGLVAVLLGVGRAIRAVVTRDRGALIYEGAAVAVVAVVAAAIVLTSLWSALGGGRPAWRLPVALAVAAASGTVPAFYFDLPKLAYLVLAVIAVLLSFITAESLLVARHCGYRLVRKAPAGIADSVQPRVETER